MALSKRELVSYKCIRCQESIVSELQDAMLELAGHLFDKHKDTVWSNAVEYHRQFPDGSFVLEKDNG